MNTRSGSVKATLGSDLQAAGGGTPSEKESKVGIGTQNTKEDGATYEGSPPSYVEDQESKIDRLEKLILRMESLMTTGGMEEYNYGADTLSREPRRPKGEETQRPNERRTSERGRVQAQSRTRLRGPTARALLPH
jgi:hypothetical protein